MGFFGEIWQERSSTCPHSLYTPLSSTRVYPCFAPPESHKYVYRFPFAMVQPKVDGFVHSELCECSILCKSHLFQMLTKKLFVLEMHCVSGLPTSLSYTKITGILNVRNLILQFNLQMNCMGYIHRCSALQEWQPRPFLPHIKT